MNLRGQESRSRRTGFTLIEMMISASLMSLILVSGYMCLNAAIASQKIVEPRVVVMQTARVVMAMMTADLRSACPLSKDYDLVGMHRMIGETPADNLDFATHNYTPKHPHEGDFCQCSYYVNLDAKTKGLSLWRRRNPRIGLDAFSGGLKEEIATGLQGLRLEYFDGTDWFESWSEMKSSGSARSEAKESTAQKGLPKAIRITLWLEINPHKPKGPEETQPPEPPLVFQTVVHLKLAGQKSSSDSNSGGAADNMGGNP